MAKGPITDPEDIAALLASARELSREHWEVVLILVKTGIEVEALRKLTWRDMRGKNLVWRRPQRREEVIIDLEDSDLANAVSGFLRRPRRSSDQLDRLVIQSRKKAGRKGLSGVTAMSLRLTRCRSMLQEGASAEAVARTLNLKLASVRRVSEQLQSEESPRHVP